MLFCTFTADKYDSRYLYLFYIPITRPLIILVESGLISEQVSLMRPIYIENFGTCVLYSEGGLNFEWSL